MCQVALSIDGRWLRVSALGQETRLRAELGSVDAGAVFRRIPLPHGRIALRSLTGEYLTLRPDPALNFGVYPQDELTPGAAFEEILWPDGKVSLRSCELTFVSVATDSARTVVANRVEAGPRERFWLVPVSSLRTQVPPPVSAGEPVPGPVPVPPRQRSSTPRLTVEPLS